jgi:hypothetical protein
MPCRILLLLLYALQLHCLNVLAFSTYNFHLLLSWMQLVQFLFSVSSYHLLYHLLICSLVFLVIVLTSVFTYIFFLPFSRLAFDVNGQTRLIFEFLCDGLSAHRLPVLCCWHILGVELLPSELEYFLLSDKQTEEFPSKSYEIMRISATPCCERLHQHAVVPC